MKTTLTPSPSPLKGEGSQSLQNDQVFDFIDDKLEAHITVQRANIVAGVRRTRLQQQAQKIAEGAGFDVDTWIACTVLWPDVMACTRGSMRFTDGTAAVWPLDWEQFRGLPDDLVMPVVDAVYTVNAHWVEKGETAITDEKKSSSTS